MANNLITIVGLGNSITEAMAGMPDPDKRWLNILDKKLSSHFAERSFRVINSGVGGNSAREAMARFDRDVLAHDPDVVILEFGGNNTDPAKPERRVGLDEFENLLNEYKQRLPAKTKTIVVTFPPVFEDLHVYGKSPQKVEFFRQFGGMDQCVDRFRNMVRDFSKTNNFPLFDFYGELIRRGRKDGRQKYTLPDGVHLTENGNEVLAEGVFKIIETLI